MSRPRSGPPSIQPAGIRSGEGRACCNWVAAGAARTSHPHASRWVGLGVHAWTRDVPVATFVPQHPLVPGSAHRSVWLGCHPPGMCAPWRLPAATTSVPRGPLSQVERDSQHSTTCGVWHVYLACVELPQGHEVTAPGRIQQIASVTLDTTIAAALHAHMGGWNRETPGPLEQEQDAPAPHAGHKRRTAVLEGTHILTSCSAW